MCFSCGFLVSVLWVVFDPSFVPLLVLPFAPICSSLRFSFRPSARFAVSLFGLIFSPLFVSFISFGRVVWAVCGVCCFCQLVLACCQAGVSSWMGVWAGGMALRGSGGVSECRFFSSFVSGGRGDGVSSRFSSRVLVSCRRYPVVPFLSARVLASFCLFLPLLLSCSCSSCRACRMASGCGGVAVGRGVVVGGSVMSCRVAGIVGVVVAAVSSACLFFLLSLVSDGAEEAASPPSRSPSRIGVSSIPSRCASRRGVLFFLSCECLVMTSRCGGGHWCLSFFFVSAFCSWS